MENGQKCNCQECPEGIPQSLTAKVNHREKYRSTISPKNNAKVSFLPDMVISKENNTTTGNFNQSVQEFYLYAGKEKNIVYGHQGQLWRSPKICL